MIVVHDQDPGKIMGCARHPNESSVGVCSSCVSESLIKQVSGSDGGRFSAKSRLSEDNYLWKEAADSSASSIASRHGAGRGDRISNTIATLMKSDYAKPESPSTSSYEGAKGSEARIPSSKSRAFGDAHSEFKDSRFEAQDEAHAHAKDHRNGRKSNGRPRTERGAMHRKEEVEVCEITEEEPDQEIAQTIHSLMDAEPKSTKFSRPSSRGSPASATFSRSSSRKNSWTVFWKTHRKEEGRSGSNGNNPVLLDPDQDTVSSISLPIMDDGNFRDVKPSRVVNKGSPSSSTTGKKRMNGKPSRRKEEEATLSTFHAPAMASREEGFKRLADDYNREEKKEPAVAADAISRISSVNGSHLAERNRNWEQRGLPKLPFASVYTHSNTGSRESRGLSWKIGKRKPDKGTPKKDSKADDHQPEQTNSVNMTGNLRKNEEFLHSNGRPPAISCFPHSGGVKLNLRRDETHVPQEKLRHRRLSIYSYGLMTQPKLVVDAHSYSGRVNRGVRPYMYNGKQREKHFPNGRANGEFWQDGDGVMSPDHYVEVSDGRHGGIVEFIPVRSAERVDPLDEWELGGNGGTHTHTWSDRSGDLEESSLVSVWGTDVSHVGKEELNTVFEEEDSESVDDFTGRGERGNQAFPRPESVAKGKGVVIETEEVEEDIGRAESHYHEHNGEASFTGPALSIRSMSDADSYARESTDSEITPTRGSLISLFSRDGCEEAEEDLHNTDRAYKPDTSVTDAGERENWSLRSDSIYSLVDSDHSDAPPLLSSISTKRSPWEKLNMSPSMRKKFLWPRSSPQPQLQQLQCLHRRGDSTTSSSGTFFDDAQISRQNSPQPQVQFHRRGDSASSSGTFFEGDNQTTRQNGSSHPRIASNLLPPP